MIVYYTSKKIHIDKINDRINEKHVLEFEYQLNILWSRDIIKLISVHGA